MKALHYSDSLGDCEFIITEIMLYRDPDQWEKENTQHKKDRSVISHERAFRCSFFNTKGSKKSTNKQERRRANRDPECIPCYKVFNG